MSAAPRSGDPLAVLRRRLSLPALGVPVPERHAAVLVALSGPSDALDVTLTRRAEHMNSHAGEVALPGGKHEPGDADLDVTALRESAEEIGLPASAVELLGRLEPLETINGLTVVPFVGFVPTLPALSANAAEIDCVFQVPLRFCQTRTTCCVMSTRWTARPGAWPASIMATSRSGASPPRCWCACAPACSMRLWTCVARAPWSTAST